jgi:hypothetical protein
MRVTVTSDPSDVRTRSPGRMSPPLADLHVPLLDADIPMLLG